VSRGRERGAALLAAVTTLAVLAVVALGFASTAIVDAQLATNMLQALQAEALARSGVAATVVVLGARDPLEPDLANARWGSGRQPLGAGTVDVTVEDEARRLDVQAPELPQLLAVLGIAPRLATALAAPDPERLLGPSLGDRARAARLDRDAARRLAAFVGTSGEPRVNPNTASREVLLALTHDAPLVDGWLRARTRGLVEPSAIPADLADRFTTRGQYYRVRAVGRVGEIRRAVEAVVQVLGDVEPAVVSWRPVSAGDDA